MKRLVVLGAGESGIGAAVLGKKQGFEVFVSDKGLIKEKYKNVLLHLEIEWEEGQHSNSRILVADVVVKSPGIPDTVPLIVEIQNKGIKVISEIEFAGRFTNAKMICITGSNGKTTTTLMTYELLKNAGFNVGLAGNIGKSLAWQVAEQDFDHYVVELSSFQLDGMFEFKADIAMILNITEDHLDRYEYNVQKYIDSNFRIIQNMTSQDFLIYGCDDEVLQKEITSRTISATCYPFSIIKEVKEGACLNENQIIINIQNQQFTMSIFDLALAGKHNIYNNMATGIAAKILEIRKEVIRDSFSDFENIEHRLEHVTKVHGIEFINDSKATNVNSTWYALESMAKGVIWIVGGVDKGNDYSVLEEMVKAKVKAIICLGEDNHKIMESFEHLKIPMVSTNSMSQAVGGAYSLGTKGDSVLLSPACASFDLFENYEDRGRQFKEVVRSL